jgi:hypothetical protein
MYRPMVYATHCLHISDLYHMSANLYGPGKDWVMLLYAIIALGISTY